MKEIKFRAFYDERMFEVYAIDFTEKKCLIGEKDWQDWIDFEQLKIMQCIGLKDKNGKYIYVGDMLFDGYSYFILDGNMQYNCGCCDDIYGFLVPESRHYDDPNKDFIINEIVGNIYQNHELIEKNGENIIEILE